MSDNGFTVGVRLPFSWHAGHPDAEALRSNRLLLHVANLVEPHEPEQDAASLRIEAKLDLMLHWLGRQLFGPAMAMPEGTIVLGGRSASWLAAGETAEGEGVLSLVIHPDLPSPLVLAGRLRRDIDGCHVELDFGDEAIEEEWNRWLFRLHRRAIQEARQKNAPD